MAASSTALAAAFLLWITPTSGLLGYDCGGVNLNITSLSLTDMAECNLPDIEPDAEDAYLQLLQLNEFDHTEVIQCRIEIDRDISYCGMSSHVSVVENGKRNFIKEMDRGACKRLHDTGTLYLGNKGLITDIRANATTRVSLTLAGTTATNGYCEGTQYTDRLGTWSNVVVQGTVKITLRQFRTAVKHSTNEIILPSGIHCRTSDGECMDDETSTFWSTIPTDSCHFNQYDVLYEGKAHRLKPKPGRDSPVIYTINTRETTFALAQTTDMEICGYKILSTEHPKLFILETKQGRSFKTRAKVSVDNLDIFTYVNSKFVYVEKHMRTQLSQLYRDIMEQKCALEKQVLENVLSLSSIAPDEMAFRLMKSPGYTAVTAGEVIYIIKCVPVEVKVRHTEECYNELPVSHSNTSYFLSPRSRILLKTGTRKECSELLPPMFRVHGTWYRMMPRPIESMPPPSIQPLTRPKWKYVSPANLAGSGIYSTEDLERLRNHIMFPIEKPALINTIAQGAMGQHIPDGSVSLYNLLDEKSLEKIAESAGARLWKGFVTFGSASAGILAIFLILRLIKLVIDSLIRGYALHSIYGWSLHLLGAIWSSITHLLLQLGSNKGQRKGKEAEGTTAVAEMQPLRSQPEPKHGESDKCDKISLENEKASVAIDPSVSPMRDYGELNKYLETIRD